jgi:hypothetical protein
MMTTLDNRQVCSGNLTPEPRIAERCQKVTMEIRLMLEQPFFFKDTVGSGIP